jgi:hypothetical protein
MVTPIDPASDPQIVHLLDLLSMLPGPTQNPRFWAAVDAAGSDSEPSLAYIFEKMSYLTDFIREPAVHNLTYLCDYLMFFFADPSPELLLELTLLPGHGNRLWAEDVARTAFQLYVRYSYRDRAVRLLREKWDIPGAVGGFDWIPK